MKPIYRIIHQGVNHDFTSLPAAQGFVQRLAVAGQWAFIHTLVPYVDPMAREPSNPTSPLGDGYYVRSDT